MRRTGPAAFLLAILSLLGLLATSAQAARPLVRHTVPGIGFSIAVPPSWKAVNYRQVATSTVIDRLAQENPNLAPVLRAIRDPTSGVRFFAVDPNTVNGFATNVNLVVENVPAGTTSGSYAAAATTQLLLLTSVVQPVRRQTVRLPAGVAARLRYGLRFAIAGRSITVAITQYALVHAGRAFVVTYTTLPSHAARLSAVFAASARSIRLT